MNEETEALMGKIFQALEQNAYETDQIEAILQACKEAGLKFVPDDWKNMEGLTFLSRLLSQIKEIDNEA